MDLSVAGTEKSDPGSSDKRFSSKRVREQSGERDAASDATGMCLALEKNLKISRLYKEFLGLASYFLPRQR